MKISSTSLGGTTSSVKKLTINKPHKNQHLGHSVILVAKRARGMREAG